MTRPPHLQRTKRAHNALRGKFLTDTCRSATLVMWCSSFQYPSQPVSIMTTRQLFHQVIATILLASFVGNSSSAEEKTNRLQNWGQWRGPLSNGVAPLANPPTSWSETKNVKWKQPIPGLGHSTPVVWGDRIYLSSAIPTGDTLPPRYSDAPGAHDNSPITHRQQFVAVAVDRNDGSLVWQKILNEQLPHEGAHFSGSLASNSPATDGELSFFFFGSYGLYCLDRDGKTVWSQQIGLQNTKHGHGEGSSPVLHQNVLAVNWDHEGQSFIVAFDKRTGQELWRSERQEVTSWASPIVVVHQGVPQLIVSGTDRLRAYHLETGKTLWECGGLSANVVASPVAGNGMVFAGSSYDTRALLAIRLQGATGDITGSSHVAWTRTRATPYVPSPLLYKGAIYFLRHYQGILTRLDARTGQEIAGPFRLGPIRDIYASPVAAAGRIYFIDLDGTALVLSDDERPQVLSLNQLNDQFSASPALVGEELFLRGRNYLYCLKNDESPKKNRADP